MKISADLIKKLRGITGSPVIHCKKALEESAGNMEGAQDWLRAKGFASAEKRLGAKVAAGLVAGGQKGGRSVLLEVLCETDFVARTDMFKSFAQQTLQLSLTNDIQNLSQIQIPEPLEKGKTQTLEEARLFAIGKLQENIQIRRIEQYESEDVGLYLHNIMGDGLGLTGSMVWLDQGFGQNTKHLAEQLAMHIVAARPIFTSLELVPPEYREKELNLLREEHGDQAEGVLERNLRKISLMEQVFLLDQEEDRTVREFLRQFGEQGVRKWCKLDCEADQDQSKVKVI